jgi:hypothetical protein
MDNNNKNRNVLHSTFSYVKYHRAALAALSGIVGAQSVLLAKCVGQLLADTLSSNSVLFFYWQSYVIVIGLAISIVWQIRILNDALQQFDALYIVPVFQSFWILTSVLSGMIFFNEYKDVFFNVGNGIGFVTGVLLTIGGVYALSQRHSDTDDIELDEDMDIDVDVGETVGADNNNNNRVDMDNSDTLSVTSIRSNRSTRSLNEHSVGNMQVDLLLLPFIQHRHRHDIFKSPSIHQHLRSMRHAKAYDTSDIPVSMNMDITVSEALKRSVTGGKTATNTASASTSWYADMKQPQHYTNRRQTDRDRDSERGRGSDRHTSDFLNAQRSTLSPELQPLSIMSV